MRSFAGQLAAFAAALSRAGDGGGALRKLLANRDISAQVDGGAQVRSELHGACTQCSTEVTKFAMLFKNAASVSDASGLAVADRVERASVGVALSAARLAYDAQTCAPLRRAYLERCHALLDALSDVIDAAVSRVALGVRMLDLDQIGAVFNACEQLQALCGDAANRDASDQFLKTVAELVKDARSDLQHMIDVEPGNGDDDGDDDQDGLDDDFDDDDADLRDVAMSADEKARAERALAVINCVGVLVLQAQALLAAAGAERPVALVDGVTDAVAGVSALVDSLTAALCPPQVADEVAAATRALEAAAAAAGDSLLTHAPANDQTRRQVLQAALAKLRPPVS